MADVNILTKLNLHFHAYNAVRKSEINLDIKKDKGIQTARDRHVHRLALGAFYLYELAASALPTAFHLVGTLASIPAVLLSGFTIVIPLIISVYSANTFLQNICFTITALGISSLAVPNMGTGGHAAFNYDRIKGIFKVLISLRGSEVPRLDANKFSYYLAIDSEMALLSATLTPFLKKLADDQRLDKEMLKYVSKILVDDAHSPLFSEAVALAIVKIIEKHHAEFINIAPDLFLKFAKREEMRLSTKLWLFTFLCMDDPVKFKSEVLDGLSSYVLKVIMASDIDRAPQYLKKWVGMMPSEISAWLEINPIVVSSVSAQAIKEIKWPNAGLSEWDWQRLQQTFPDLKTITIEGYQVQSAGQKIEAWGKNDIKCEVKWPLDASKLWDTAEKNISSLHMPILQQFGLTLEADKELIAMAFTGKGSTETLLKMASCLEQHPYVPIQQDVETDFEIKVGDSSVKVHKAVLCLNSPFFLNLIDFELEKETEHTLSLEYGATPETIKAIIDYCYTKKLIIPQGVDQSKVIMLANFLGIQLAKDAAEDALITDIQQNKEATKGQLAEVLDFAKNYFCQKLESAVNKLMH